MACYERYIDQAIGGAATLLISHLGVNPVKRLRSALSALLLVSVGLIALTSPPAQALPAAFQRQT
ncbi:hypothetical protein, partial [Nonomuraea sp. NPDC002799]